MIPNKLGGFTLNPNERAALDWAVSGEGGQPLWVARSIAKALSRPRLGASRGAWGAKFPGIRGKLPPGVGVYEVDTDRAPMVLVKVEHFGRWLTKKTNLYTKRHAPSVGDIHHGRRVISVSGGMVRYTHSSAPTRTAGRTVASWVVWLRESNLLSPQ